MARAILSKGSPVVYWSVLMFLLATLAGCGGSDTAAESSRCQPLPAPARELLGGVLYGGELGTPVYVRSEDFAHVFMVAALVNGRPAVWAMNQLDGTGAIISVNEQAFQVSGMARGELLRDPILVSDDGVEQALACVEPS